MTINPTLTAVDFAKLPASVRDAFLNSKAEIVTLPKDMSLFKLSAGVVKADPKRGTLTPWWSPVQPFQEDKLGAVGRFQEARLNKVSMREMVRFASAVSVDWNDLDNYLEVSLDESVKCFWGQYTPQPAFQDAKSIKGRVKFFEHQAKNIYTPDILGGIEAWQFFIPNLLPAHVKVEPTIPAHDMGALAVHLGISM